LALKPARVTKREMTSSLGWLTLTVDYNLL
jgi:hypothetical protein